MPSALLIHSGNPDTLSHPLSPALTRQSPQACTTNQCDLAESANAAVCISPANKAKRGSRWDKFRHAVSTEVHDIGEADAAEGEVYNTITKRESDWNKFKHEVSETVDDVEEADEAEGELYNSITKAKRRSG